VRARHRRREGAPAPEANRLVAPSRHELSARLAGESTVQLVGSPYDGRIAELKVNVGEIVERGTSLFTIL